MIAADAGIEVLLDALKSKRAEVAWQALLSAYSDLIYSVIRTIARDADQSGDCFLFVCSKLADKHYKRLLAFRPNGRARFSTWLRAVVRNLCLDWHRSEFGRSQLFRSIAARDALDQDIFRAVFQRRVTLEEAWREVAQRQPGITLSEIEKRVDKIRSLLSARQLWLLSSSAAATESIDSDADSVAMEIPDRAPDPEALSVLREARDALARAISQADTSDQLLLRLRFVENLALRDVARLVGLKDAQTADRRTQRAIERLREKLGANAVLRGKPKSASV